TVPSRDQGRSPPRRSSKGDVAICRRARRSAERSALRRVASLILRYSGVRRESVASLHVVRFACGGNPPRRAPSPSGFQRSTQLKLDRLKAAVSVRDLAALPGNHFEALSGDRKGQYSVRITNQWRICFESPAG